jgi:hypothetical protein
MPESPHNIIILKLAKGSTAQLRLVIDQCDDRDIARTLYAELSLLKIKLAAKHNFPAERNLKERKAA